MAGLLDFIPNFAGGNGGMPGAQWAQIAELRRKEEERRNGLLAMAQAAQSSAPYPTGAAPQQPVPQRSSMEWAGPPPSVPPFVPAMPNVAANLAKTGPIPGSSMTVSDKRPVSGGFLAQLDPKLADSPAYRAFDRNRNAISGAILGGVGYGGSLEGVRGMAAGLEAGGQYDDALAMANAPQPADPTSQMRNYEALVAMGVEPGEALNRAFSGGVSVQVGSEVGTIPQGYELYTDPQSGARSLRPIPGGPAEQEQQDAATQEAARTAQREASGGVVVEDIDRVLGAIKDNPSMTTGMGAAITQSIPGTPAYNAAQLTATIRANTGFDRLQQMRDASPTGGALGQVSEMENRLLQAALGNLELSQNREQLEYNLKRVKNIYLDIIHGPGNGPAREDLSGGGSNGVPAGVSPEQWNVLTPEERALWQ